MRTATLDTNVFPAEDLIARASAAGIEVACVSVSKREVAGSSLEEEVAALASLLETGVWGESAWDECNWASEDDDLENALTILSNGSFPAPASRGTLSSGQRRQLRDAMILCTHARAGRDVLVSNDARAFVNEGRRERIEASFMTRVMTRAEFEAHLARSSSTPNTLF